MVGRPRAPSSHKKGTVAGRHGELGPLKLWLEAGGQSPVTSGQIWAQGEVTVPAFRLKISEIREASPVICRAIKKMARA